MRLSSGTRLGGFEILTPLGAGGMGVVYRARDTRLKRDVAVKVLVGAPVDDADRRVRFQREVADAIRRLRPDVEILNPAPTITGDTAVITSAITLSTKLPPLSMTVPQVSIEFRRENAREWLVLPASKWRVVGVDVPEEVVQSLQMPF